MAYRLTQANLKDLSPQARSKVQAALKKEGLEEKTAFKKKEDPRIQEAVEQTYRPDSERPIYVEFTLPYPVVSLNKWIEMHYRDKRKEIDRIIEHFCTQVKWNYRPYRTAKMTVERHARYRLDKTNAEGSVKGLEDALQPRSARHPYGIGVIMDDSEDALKRAVVQVKAPIKNEHTVVRIWCTE